MDNIAHRLKAYIDSYPFDSGDSGCDTVLDQIYQAYADSRESDPPAIKDGFAELGDFLEQLPLDENNRIFSIILRLCIEHEHRAFLDGLQYGAHLILELHK